MQEKVELELKRQIAALLARAKAADDAEKNAPALNIPAEIARREDRLAVIAAAGPVGRASASNRQRAWPQR
jgi:hypothetical protein